MLADFSDHLAGPGFRTIVAGTNILWQPVLRFSAGCHELCGSAVLAFGNQLLDLLFSGAHSYFIFYQES